MAKPTFHWRTEWNNGIPTFTVKFIDASHEERRASRRVFWRRARREKCLFWRRAIRSMRSHFSSASNAKGGGNPSCRGEPVDGDPATMFDGVSVMVG